jgi:outer membrane murein-binding lipoprotein Lpp
VTRRSTLVAVALLAGCGSSADPNASIRRDLDHGVAQIRATYDRKQLRAELLRTVERLRRDEASTPAGRRAKKLALAGFVATLRGVQSQIDFVDNDSGNVAAATRDAVRADRFLAKGARLLRAARRALDGR